MDWFLYDSGLRHEKVNNGGITKSGEFVNYMEVPNIFIDTVKIYCNSLIESCCSW